MGDGTHVVGSYSEAGGVTKTITGLSIAVTHAEENPDEEVIYCDLDPRAAGTKWTGAEPHKPGLHMGAIVAAEDPEGWADELAVPLDPDYGWPRNLRVIPSGYRVLANHEKNPDDHAELRLKRSLAGTRAGLVSVDFPNRQGGILTQNGLSACDRLIYAAKPDEDGLDGVEGAMETVQRFKQHRRMTGATGDLPREVGITLGAAYTGAVWTRDALQVVDLFDELYPGMLLRPFVERLVIVSESRRGGAWYGKYRKGTSVRDAYNELRKEVLRK
ncbi:ParA family protein [Streptomyces sp. GKU 257-1]|nr:ParA family protein [Streptomyces sp. GKU 257-1]